MRSGYVAAKSIDSGPPSDMPIRAARSEPTASMTARMSSIRSSSEPTETWSERPIPRLSNMIKREKLASRFRKLETVGSVHWKSRCESQPQT